VVDAKVPRWLRLDMCDVTLGSRVHFCAGAREAQMTEGIEPLELELVRVRQFYEGTTLRR